MGGASLVASGGDQTPGKPAFTLQGINVDIRIAIAGQATVDLDRLIRRAGGIGANTAGIRIDPESQSGIRRVAVVGMAGAEFVKNRTTGIG